SEVTPGTRGPASPSMPGLSGANTSCAVAKWSGGCEIVAAVDGLELSAEQKGERALAVGVGIATGRAVVGNVETKDRLIYTAIGDTVNLASRLQSMTRDLDAAIAIDARTREGGCRRGDVPAQRRETRARPARVGRRLDPAPRGRLSVRSP